MQLKDIGPGIVAHRIEIQAGTGDLSKINVRGQDGLAREIWTGENLPKRADDAASAAGEDRIRLVPERRLVFWRVVPSPGELVAGQDKAAAFLCNMLHCRQPSVSSISGRRTIDLNTL